MVFQLIFLFMTYKNICLQTFFYLKYLKILVYFLGKNCIATLPEKVHHLFPSNASLKVENCQAPFINPNLGGLLRGYVLSEV